MAVPSSSGSPETTASWSEHLIGILHGVDTESWTPGSASDASGAIESVSAFCRDFCPARLACIEDRCRLYRVEQRAIAHLRGPRHNAATESVGVIGEPVTGISGI